ncbi:MAG TPA: alpha/beta hydrolase family protein [Verrucomicrobiae bacterium]|nr:alpha/beta hydrolase family protein [Verrucomicrobiae bacterium]
MRVEFRSGDFKLAGVVDLPREGAARSFAIFAPCFTCNKNIKTAAYISRGLAEHGIGVLRIDFRGLGESEGIFAEANLSTNVADVVAASEFLQREYSAPGLLVGHSFGGPAVIRAAAKIASCRAVATINSPADPLHVASYFADKLERIRNEGSVSVDIVGRPFPMTRQFIEDLQKQNHPAAISSLADLGKALLVCHAPADDVVPLAEAAEIFEAAKHPKSFVSLDKADHYLFKREDADYAAKMIATWAARYV